MRTVRLDWAVVDDLEEARRIWDRLDDAWAMIEWVLARDPTKGDPLTESGTARSFFFAGSNAHSMPDIQIVYVDESPYVTIKSVRFSNPSFMGGSA